MPKRDAPPEPLKGQVSRPGKRAKGSEVPQEDQDAVDASWMKANGLNFRDATVGYADTFLDSSEVKECMQELLDLDDCVPQLYTYLLACLLRQPDRPLLLTVIFARVPAYAEDVRQKLRTEPQGDRLCDRAL